MYANELIKSIENIRRKRKITLEDLTFDIVDIKQYRKYVYEQSKIPFNTIFKLVDRLGMRFEDLLSDYLKEQFEESNVIVELINNISSNNYEEAEKTLSSIDRDSLLQSENKVFYDIAFEFVRFNREKCHISTFEKKLCELIDFPKVLAKEVLTVSEIYVLGELLDIVTPSSQKKILSKISLFLDDSKFNFKIVNQIIVRINLYLETINDYKGIIKNCLIGEKNCMRNQNFYLLDYFYYSLAYCNNVLSQHDEMNKYIMKCYHTIMLEDKPDVIHRFEHLFELDFEKKLSVLVKDIINKANE